jgi:hypothetical protein
MRCPYCGSLNTDTVHFCNRCGRDVMPPTAQRSPTTTVPRPQQSLNRPQTNIPPRPQQPVTQPVQPATRSAPSQAQPSSTSARTARSVPPTNATTTTTNRAPITEAPIPFPPRTLDELKKLEAYALHYMHVDEILLDGKKKVVCIAFLPCTPWQQVATLLKALTDCDTSLYNTIIIQGVRSKSTDIYNYTDGQLIFDRNVRLGTQLQKRYTIETGNGYSQGSLRLIFSD